jgi:hypothetical protein
VEFGAKTIGLATKTHHLFVTQRILVRLSPDRRPPSHPADSDPRYIPRIGSWSMMKPHGPVIPGACAT